MPRLIQRFQADMFAEATNNGGVENGFLKERERREKRDNELYAQAYKLPKDSLAVVPGRTYRRGMSTTPILHSIGRRKHDTKVTFMQPVYWDWQWLYYSPGYKIIDRRNGDEYGVIGYDGGASMDRLLAVEGFNGQYIYLSLLFQRIKKGHEGNRYCRTATRARRAIASFE